MQIRLRKDGGYSECNAPDHLVGKGRCIHVLESGDDMETLEINRVSRGMYQVDIPNDIVDDVKSKEDILSYINDLPKISKTKQKSIIQSLMEL